MKIEQIISERGYQVTEDGRLLNPKGKIIGDVINSNGRKGSCVRVKGKKVNFFHHRLQAFQKYGLALFEKGIEVRHLNNNPLDNSWDNISIGTHSQNMMDIPEQIRIKKALHATSFVRKYDKEEVKKFHKISNSYKLTMAEFNISSKGTLNFILKN